MVARTSYNRHRNSPASGAAIIRQGTISPASASATIEHQVAATSYFHDQQPVRDPYGCTAGTAGRRATGRAAEPQELRLGSQGTTDQQSDGIINRIEGSDAAEGKDNPGRWRNKGSAIVGGLVLGNALPPRIPSLGLVEENGMEREGETGQTRGCEKDSRRK